jgi:hypothetical protein
MKSGDGGERGGLSCEIVSAKQTMTPFINI